MKTLSIVILTLKDGLRNRVLYGVIVAALLLIVLSIFLSGLFMRDVFKVLLDICLSAVSAGGLLVPFFVAVSHLSGDLERKSIFTLLSCPVSRYQYMLGKYFGLCALTFLIMVILTGATFFSIYCSIMIYPRTFIPAIPISQILSTVFLSFAATSVLISCAMLWCSLTTSSFLATLLTICTYLVGQTVETIVRFIAAKFSGISISPLIDYATQGIMYIFPNLGAFDYKQHATHGLPIQLSEMTFLCLYGAVYISIMLLLSMLVFGKRDLT